MILDRITTALTRPDVGRSRVSSGHAPGLAANSEFPTVLQVVRTYLPHTENWIYEQVRHLERYRSVYASKATANVDTFPFSPIYSASRARPHARLLGRGIQRLAGHSPFFSAVARQENASILHAHGGGIARVVVSSAQRAGIPMVVSFYGFDMWKHPDGEAGLRRKYDEVFQYATLTLAEGPAAVAQLIRIGCHEDRIAIHRLGVDTGSLPFTPRTLSNGSELQVLMASRFVEKKGIPYGVEGFCRVARDNPRMRLTIVGDSGSGKDARLRKEYESIARRHAVGDQVNVLGFMSREELLRLAERHHILLHPSVKARTGDAEGGHPVVMTMLAASGMPILATRHCDIPEIVRDGETGWLVAERSADEIEAKLRGIAADPSVLSRFGCAARQLVEEKYDIRSVRLDSVYDRVLVRR